MSIKTIRKSVPHAAPLVKHVPRAVCVVPPLESGDALSASEFLRRYEVSPDIKKAELIDGIVYIMASPVRADKHGDPDNLMQWFLCNYAIATWGVKATSNATTRLGPKNIPQPDVSLRYLPVRSGRKQFDRKGYLKYPPELVVEIAYSSASIDSHRKRDAYLKERVPEYILWNTFDSTFNWWYWENGVYLPLQPDKDGILRSRKFPGLWLDPKAILADDMARVKLILERGLKSPEHAAFVKKI